MPTKQLSRGLSGVAGEYFVAAELSRRSYIASITLRNTKGIDILASNEDASKSVGIQVKTSQKAQKDWILSKGAEDYFNDNLFYVFVDLKDELSRPNFHIVPSETVARRAKKEYEEWIAEMSPKTGKARTETTMRWFIDPKDEYLERWDLLGLEGDDSGHRVFFDRLRDKLLSIEPKFVRANAPSRPYWDFGIGRAGFCLYAVFTAYPQTFRIGIYINIGERKDNEAAFSKLKESRDRIEKNIGKELVWDSCPTLKTCSVYLPMDGSIDDGQRLNEIIEWAAPTLIKFRQVFVPLVKSV